MRRTLVVVAICFGSTARAEPRVRAVVDTPPEAFTPASPATPLISPFLYLNRCTGGCVVHGGTMNDARAQKTSIPVPGDYQIGEFADATGLTGAAADGDWAALVQCMKEVYSPYAITVTDTIPDGASYTEAIIAGQPGDIGRPVDNLGVAPIAANCAAQDNVISFSFANHHPGMGQARILDICWTAAQESAHAFGLDHEYVFTDGTSTCRDPMTYRNDCGGQRFFRNSRAQCGEDAPRACRCGGTQNSHVSLLNVFGAGTPITTPPHTSITLPTGGSIANGSVVHATAGAQRGVAKMELFLNGSRWSVAPGAPFGTAGQLDEDYALAIPNSVPNSTIDIVVRASDDLGVFTDSAPVTVNKGAPCTDASQCAGDQKCTNGRCLYDPPTGELGDSCSYGQQCKSWECADTGNGKFCATDCEPDEPTSCPSSYVCADTGGGHGLCVTSDGGGCCSVGRGGARPWAHGALGILVLGILLRRRSR